MNRSIQLNNLNKLLRITIFNELRNISKSSQFRNSFSTLNSKILKNSIKSNGTILANGNRYITNDVISLIVFVYRKRLNNGPPFFHTCVSYINRVHACKKSGLLVKRLRYYCQN